MSRYFFCNGFLFSFQTCLLLTMKLRSVLWQKCFAFSVVIEDVSLKLNLPPVSSKGNSTTPHCLHQYCFPPFVSFSLLNVFFFQHLVIQLNLAYLLTVLVCRKERLENQRDKKGFSQVVCLQVFSGISVSF